MDHFQLSLESELSDYVEEEDGAGGSTQDDSQLAWLMEQKKKVPKEPMEQGVAGKDFIPPSQPIHYPYSLSSSSSSSTQQVVEATPPSVQSTTTREPEWIQETQATEEDKGDLQHTIDVPPTLDEDDQEDDDDIEPTQQDVNSDEEQEEGEDEVNEVDQVEGEEEEEGGEKRGRTFFLRTQEVPLLMESEDEDYDGEHLAVETQLTQDEEQQEQEQGECEEHTEERREDGKARTFFLQTQDMRDFVDSDSSEDDDSEMENESTPCITKPHIPSTHTQPKQYCHKNDVNETHRTSEQHRQRVQEVEDCQEQSHMDMEEEEEEEGTTQEDVATIDETKSNARIELDSDADSEASWDLFAQPNTTVTDVRDIRDEKIKCKSTAKEQFTESQDEIESFGSTSDEETSDSDFRPGEKEENLFLSSAQKRRERRNREKKRDDGKIEEEEEEENAYTEDMCGPAWLKALETKTSRSSFPEDSPKVQQHQCLDLSEDKENSPILQRSFSAPVPGSKMLSRSRLLSSNGCSAFNSQESQNNTSDTACTKFNLAESLSASKPSSQSKQRTRQNGHTAQSGHTAAKKHKTKERKLRRVRRRREAYMGVSEEEEDFVKKESKKSKKKVKTCVDSEEEDVAHKAEERTPRVALKREKNNNMTASPTRKTKQTKVSHYFKRV